MPRGRSTFNKRQKEQQRQQKQREKAERKNLRKEARLPAVPYMHLMTFRRSR
jgi:hypothetical protein